MFALRTTCFAFVAALSLTGAHIASAQEVASATAAQAQHVRGGKMRALALTGDKRSHTMPDVPTLKEMGIDVVAHAWWGILAPAATPNRQAGPGA